MAAVVTVDYQLGGKSNLSRADLNKIIKALGIPDPLGKLPTGRRCRYVLVLETSEKVPKTCPPAAKK